MDIEERFLKYVSIDTQSDEYSDTTPSTLKQLDLGKELVKEMLELGITDAHLDEYGIVYGTIKGNGGTGDIIGFIAHMDTSPDASGTNIKPQKINNYDGSIIEINKELGLSLDPEEFVSLKKMVGHDLITTDGTTLLGRRIFHTDRCLSLLLLMKKSGVELIISMLINLEPNMPIL